MNLLLTGSTGYIGKNILLNLSGSIDNIYALRRDQNYRYPQILNSSKVKFIGIKEIEEIMTNENISAVIHLATFYGDDRKDNEDEINHTNVEFPKNLLDLAIQNEVNCFVNADSFFAKQCYDLGYKSLYTNSKRKFEKILKSKASDIKIANMRLEHVYGSNDNPQKFVGWLTSQFKNKLIEEINLSECYQKRDFIYVLDVVSAFMSVIENIDKLKGYTEFQIGTGKATIVKEFVKELEVEFLKYQVFKKINFKPELNRFGEIPHSVADLSNNSLIKWKAKYNLNEGIKDLVYKEMN